MVMFTPGPPHQPQPANALDGARAIMAMKPTRTIKLPLMLNSCRDLWLSGYGQACRSRFCRGHRSYLCQNNNLPFSFVFHFVKALIIIAMITRRTAWMLAVLF